MKISAAQPEINKAERVNGTALRRIVGLVLMASFISFATAWVIKGEAAKNGGVKKMVEQWANARGNMALSSESSYLNLLKIPYYMLRPADVPQLVVDIDFKNFQKLQSKRTQALEKGLLVTGKGDFVAAKIRHEGKTSKVKLRLKGDLLDHLKGDKWSFRVKVKGKDHLFGMRRFSVQNPLTRGFQGGPLFYATLKRYGVLAPRYKFVNLVVNGSDLGIMSLEEHFSKELLESSGRKESVIIKFDESLVWDATDGRKHAGLGGHFDNFHVATIDGFGTKKITQSERLTKDYTVAVGLLRAFETGALAPSEVFDVGLMARYIAISELWGSWHSFSWRNLRFYFNPITARLEPIGNDPDIQTRSRPGANNAKNEPITSVMRDMLLSDPVIYAEFEKAVQLIGEDIKDGDLIAELEQLQNKYLAELRAEYFFLQPFDHSELAQRAALLEAYNKEDFDSLYQVKYLYPELLQAYEINDAGNSHLELTNITPSWVEVLSIKWVANNDDNKKIDVKFTENVTFPLSLQAAPGLAKPRYRKISFNSSQALQKDYHLEVLAKVRGAQEIVKTKVQPYHGALQNRPVPTSSLQQQVSKHKQYLLANTSGDTMTIKPGQWRVNESIIVPENTVLEMNAGTTLQFASSAGIISHGSLRFIGKENGRVRLQGIDAKSWQGIAVLNATDDSTLSHVVIKETIGMNEAGWSLTGGVTFYNSDVTIKDTTFEDSRGEDALNIVHSSFTLQDVLIRKTASDAFDADFSSGAVIGGIYEDIGLAGGGDAIDISGSDVTVENTRFVNIDDKALSVGEQSAMRASGLDINGTGTGAASKDDSKLELVDSKIDHARVAGLMAYIKKPEFGPGRIISSGINFGDGFEKARVQKGNYIRIDNNEVETIDIDVKDMYKTIMKPGLR